MVANFESVRLPIKVKRVILSTTSSQNCRSTGNNVSKHEAVISTALDTASIPVNYLLLYALHTTNHYDVHSFVSSLIHIEQYFSIGATQYFLVSLFSRWQPFHYFIRSVSHYSGSRWIKSFNIFQVSDSTFVSCCVSQVTLNWIGESTGHNNGVR